MDEQESSPNVAYGEKAPMAFKGVKYHAKIYSKILGESFTLYSEGKIIFDSGAEYSKKEWLKLRGLDKDELISVHQAKTAFNESTTVYKGKRGKNEKDGYNEKKQVGFW